MLNLLLVVLGILVIVLGLEYSLTTETAKRMEERQPFMFNFLMKTSRFSLYLVMAVTALLVIAVNLF